MENKKEDLMEIILILLALLIVLDLASWRWGVNSTDDLDSCEWERRRHWGENLGDQLGVC